MQKRKIGIKYDDDKIKWELLPLRLLNGAVKVLMKGAIKYAPRDWTKVENAKVRYYNALVRHIADLQEDDGKLRLNHINEQDFNYPTLWHIIVNSIFLEYFRLKEENKIK